MRWIVLLPAIFFLAACCNTNREVIEYRQVLATPPCYTSAFVDEEPVDVTTTTVQYF
ncbi:hypothetical protein Lqui_0120 [Legionella quinlivanii]|uniref:Uncharacterized protein n=1 Tax=Legionella quinlivanii TaxID=45073 RepID=A0A0W0Y6T4_9GAMM|nr:hypothetical protein [Legionella quinlivanii]KTD52554.1 hypothetical protein Lqui_0120 [Legionella quinlivanii]MCW8449747.1 hypothetical protein [Legionella quinlivanii]SEF70413.1 hypothetical protein SAMN02746093_00806 [Legionella quinlivanii DSM 21216]STY12102.1 Uncharacterised protein [Legionella quinlivanii]